MSRDTSPTGIGSFAMVLKPAVIHFFTEDGAYITWSFTNPPTGINSWHLKDQWWQTATIVGPSQYGEDPDVWKVVLRHSSIAETG